MKKTRKKLSRKSQEKLKKEDVEISFAETEQRSFLKELEALLKEAEKKISDAISLGTWIWFQLAMVC